MVATLVSSSRSAMARRPSMSIRPRSHLANHCGKPRDGRRSTSTTSSPAKPSGCGADAQVGQRRSHAGAVEHVGPQHGVDRDAGLGQRHVGREQQRVDPGEDGDAVGGRPRARPATPARGRRAPGRRPRAGAAARRRASGSGDDVRAGPDLLGHPPVVVRQQVAGGVDDGDRAPVVDLERVVGGAGEQAGEVDEERRVGAGVAVDDLVVVADAEHVEPGRGQQPEQEHVGRRQVLQLVDEQVAAPGLRLPAPVAVAQQQLDGAVHLLVEVDGSRGRQLPRGTDRRRRPGRGRRPARPRPPPDRAARGGPATAPPRYGADRVGVGRRRWRGHQLLDEPAHLALVEHARRPAVRLGEEGVAERVERLDAGPEVGRARLHLLLGLLVVGDGQHALPLEAPVDDAGGGAAR